MRARREKHRDEINARNRERRKANPGPIRAAENRQWHKHKDRYNAAKRNISDEERARRNARRRADRAARPDFYRQQERRHRERDPERKREMARAYYAAHPEKWQKARRAREARKAGVEYQPYTRTEIFERDGGVCRGCGRELVNEPGGFQLDHIVPISLGGPDIPANLQLMCAPCNRGKWAKLEGQIHLPL